jgi:hypothetical protein
MDLLSYFWLAAPTSDSSMPERHNYFVPHCRTSSGAFRYEAACGSLALGTAGRRDHPASVRRRVIRAASLQRITPDNGPSNNANQINVYMCRTIEAG